MITDEQLAEPYGEAHVDAACVAALKRAVKAIEVSHAHDLDDGTVLHDVRIKGLLARHALLFDLCLEVGLVPDVASILLDADIGEDLVLASLYRRLEARGVDRRQLWEEPGGDVPVESAPAGDRWTQAELDAAKQEARERSGRLRPLLGDGGAASVASTDTTKEVDHG